MPPHRAGKYADNIFTALIHHLKADWKKLARHCIESFRFIPVSFQTRTNRNPDFLQAQDYFKQDYFNIFLIDTGQAETIR